MDAVLLDEALALLGRAESADRSLSAKELKQLRELLGRAEGTEK